MARANADALPDEVRSDLAKYLCVRVSGYIEQAVREILEQYAQTKAHERVARVAGRQVSRLQNPSKGHLLELVDAFDPEWKTQLETFLTDERDGALTSIMSNRHQIAHGGDSGITLVRLREWAKPAMEVVDFLDGLCVR